MRLAYCTFIFLTAFNSVAQDLSLNGHEPLLHQLESINATSNELSFKENGGQVRDQHWQPRPDVLYSGVTSGLHFHLRTNGISYQIVSMDESPVADNNHELLEEQEPPELSIYRVDVNWVNSNENIKVIQGKELQGYSNYYNVPEGNSPALMVKKFEDVKFKDVWPGIDLLYYNNSGTLESDWLLERAEDYTRIAFDIEGADVQADEQGFLTMKTPFGEIREGKLTVFQDDRILNAGWVTEPSARGTRVSFHIEGFEHGKPMRIDPPTSLWSTFYGGTGADEGQACTSDLAGNLYLSGRTNSAANIATTDGFLNYALGGSWDAFLVKFNADGLRLWATYYGWSGWDEGSACTTDNLGNVYLAGRTNSTAMIGSTGAHQPFSGGGNDAFLAKFNSNGVRLWGTFYGGSASDLGAACATDSENNVYLTGRSLSNNNIGTPGSHQQFRVGSDDAFIVKFNPSGVRQWGTYYGGSGQDVGLAITVSSSDLIHIGGYTASSSNIATAGTYQPNIAGGQFSGFLAQFNTDGVQQWGTYYSGTSGWTWVLDCDVDATGNIYISGLTQSPVNIASPGSHQQFFGGGSRDGFLAKMNSSGNRTWGTYFGGGGNDDAFGCTVSADNRVYIVGGTSSTDGIASDEATQPENGGGTNDAYLAQFDADGAFLWGSYFGGSGNDIAYGCHANSNGIYMTGFTGSTNVFASPGAHQPGYGGGATDAFFGALESLGCTEAPEQPGAVTGPTEVCDSDEVSYSIAAVSGATSYTWTLPNGWSGNSTTTSITATAGANAGAISVVANNACGSSAAQSVNVTVGSAPDQPGAITGPSEVCNGDEVSYSIAAVSGATSYTWTLPNGWSGNSTTTSITASTGVNGGAISVVANNACGSSAAQSVNVTVGSAPAQPGAITGPSEVCNGDEVSYSIAAVSGATSYTWTLPNGWSGNSTTTSITATAGANGGAISVVANNACGSSAAQSVNVTVGSAPAQPDAITGPTEVCNGDETSYSIAAVSGATSYTWTLPNGWSGNSTTTSITATTGANGGAISVVANNACGSSAAQSVNVTVGSAPAQPGAITGPTEVCDSDEVSYSIAAVSGATSYTWTLPNGWSGNSTSTSITATAGANGGAISVVANNACGSSAAQSVNVNVGSAPAQPGAITGNILFCEGDTATFSVEAVDGATSYTWSLPEGWTGSSTGTSIDFITGNSGGAVSVTANNQCGASTATTQDVSSHPLPDVAFEIEFNVVCNTFGDFTLTGGFPEGGTYSGTGITNGVFSPEEAGEGVHVITYTYLDENECGNSSEQEILVEVCTNNSDLVQHSTLIYPNPFRSTLEIEFDAERERIIEVYNTVGQIVHTLHHSGLRVTMNASLLAPGMYFIKVSGDDNVYRVVRSH